MEYYTVLLNRLLKYKQAGYPFEHPNVQRLVSLANLLRGEYISPN